MGLSTSGTRSPALLGARVGSFGWSATTRSIIGRVTAGVGAVAILMLIEPMLLKGSPYWLSVATNANILGLGALGLWLMFAIGRTDIAQGAFAAVGGYTTAILTTRYDVSFWLCLPFSAIVAGLVATVIGLPILRLRGVYFAMVTLSLTEVTRLAALNGGSLTNGAKGIVAIPQAALLEGPMQFYLLSAALVLLGALLVWRIAESRIGDVFRSMRQNEDLSSSLGINITQYRVIAFGVASGMGGLCGSFLAESQQNIFPATYTIQDSINFMLYCFLGGLDYVLGPVLGTYLLVVAFELLDALQRYQALLYGALMIGVMLFLPNGLLSIRFGEGRRRS
jgi:branched-chain amino acid transport system permease protein